MYGLTATKRLLNRARRTRGLAAFALAALIFPSALPATARGQAGGGGGGAGKVSMRDFSFVASVGVTRGETLRVGVPNYPFQDGSVRVISGNVKVFDGSTGSLLQSHEISRIPNVYTYIDAGHHALAPGGDPDTGRLQLLIKVELVVSSTQAGQAEEPAAGLLPPTFELIDDATGRTTVYGTFGTGAISFTGLD